MDEHDTSNEIRQNPEKKYPALTGIARFYKTLAYLMGFFAVIACFVGIANVISEDNSNPMIGALFIIASIIVGPVSVITFLALSESIMVFIDIAGSLTKIKEDMGEDLSEIKRRLADKSD